MPGGARIRTSARTRTAQSPSLAFTFTAPLSFAFATPFALTFAAPLSLAFSIATVSSRLAFVLFFVCVCLLLHTLLLLLLLLSVGLHKRYVFVCFVFFCTSDVVIRDHVPVRHDTDHVLEAIHGIVCMCVVLSSSLLLRLRKPKFHYFDFHHFFCKKNNQIAFNLLFLCVVVVDQDQDLRVALFLRVVQGFFKKK